MNEELLHYIDKKIFPSYQRNEVGHQLDHIQSVIHRSLMFAKNISNINLDMVFTIAAYHDIGYYIDAFHYAMISAQILRQDPQLKNFFTEEQIEIMEKAILDHHTSLEPRSIYGKIISSADRNVAIHTTLKRSYHYHVKFFPSSSLEAIIENTRKYIIDKFGSEGYIRKKIYFEDLEYQQYLTQITRLANDTEEFTKQFIKINQIKR